MPEYDLFNNSLPLPLNSALTGIFKKITMCFTVNVNLIKEELENRYGATLIDPDKYRPSYYYHAFGLPEIPAICSPEPDKIKLLKWGLIPSWTRSIEDANIIRYKTFNARAESIDKKPSFSSSFRSKRCIIPVRDSLNGSMSERIKFHGTFIIHENEILSVAGFSMNGLKTVQVRYSVLFQLLQLMQMI